MASFDNEPPLPMENVDGFLRQYYGRNILHAYRSVQKCYFRVESTKLDIEFLKTCRLKNVIPKFLWFKTANWQLAWSWVYKDCQRRLLNVEINWKFQHMYNSKKGYDLSVNVLRQLISNRLFEDLHRMAIHLSSLLLQVKEEKLDRKLWSLGVRNKLIETNDPKVVINLLSRVLLKEEITCLANGLDYGLFPKLINRLTIASNVEQFYHQGPCKYCAISFDQKQ